MTATPVHERGEVFAVSRVGEYTHLTVIAPGVASAARPGQFASLAIGDETSGLLTRRAMAIAGATPGDAYAGTVEFLVAERGAGTRWLAHRRSGDTLDLIGPLGTPFPVPSGPSPAVLVGGGYGAAGLMPLAHALRAGGSPLEFVLGAASAARLYGELAAKRIAGRVTVTTGDGSAGVRGLVTDLLPDAIVRLDAQVVYACGPMPMLARVAAIAQEHAIRSQVAVEQDMACGFGVCGTCVLPVRGEDGRSRFVRSCVDGPVFEGGRVRWSDVGRLPSDVVGAAGVY